MKPRLVGMVHLGPLPGSPEAGDFDDVVERARRDAEILRDAGFYAVLVENFGDAPFYPDRVPAETVAAMTRIVAEIIELTALPTGVNVLRNDPESALAIAAATGAAFIRANVLAGTMFTDQGIIEGRAAEVGRLRRALDAEVEIWADVMVKHAVAPPGLTLEQAAVDTWERGGADGLIVSGVGTGQPTDIDTLKTVRSVVPDAPLMVGSGATVDTVAEQLSIADGLIVGSALKRNGDPHNPIDSKLAAALVEAAS